jgi:hypothetical protein
MARSVNPSFINDLNMSAGTLELAEIFMLGDLELLHRYHAQYGTLGPLVHYD